MRPGLCRLLATALLMTIPACFEPILMEGWPCEIHEDCHGLVCGSNNCCNGVCYEYWCADVDEDGFGQADLKGCVFGKAPPAHRGWAPNHSDCDDHSAETHPGAASLEVAGSERCMKDEDGDGWGASSDLGEGVSPGRDCDDSDGALYDCIGCNLLAHGDAEVEFGVGAPTWQEAPSLFSVSCVGTPDPALFHRARPSDCPDIGPRSGKGFFVVGGACSPEPKLPPAQAYHVCVRVPLAEELFVEGKAALVLRAQLRANAFDQAGLALLPLDADGALIAELCEPVLGSPQPDGPVDTFPSPPCSKLVEFPFDQWTTQEIRLEVPDSTVEVQLVLRGRRQADSIGDTQAYFDDIMIYEQSCPGSSQ